MPPGRLASVLSCALALAACKRPSEPPPGPGAKPSSAPSASVSAPDPASSSAHISSPHERDMPEKPPPRPPSDNAKLIRASHILIAYQGALDAAPSVTRTKEAAQMLAQSVAMEARAGADFTSL